MASKKFKKTVLDVHKLSEFLNQKYADMHFDDFKQLDSNIPIIHDICVKMFNNVDRKSKIYIKSYFKRNTGNLRQLLTNKLKTDIIRHSNPPNAVNINIQHFRDVIRKANINMQILFADSYYKNDAIYSTLCKLLNKKNSLRNRKKIKAFCYRNHLEIFKFKETSENTKGLIPVNEIEIIDVLKKEAAYTSDIVSIKPFSSKSLFEINETVDICHSKNIQNADKLDENKHKKCQPISSDKYDIPKEIQILEFTDTEFDASPLPKNTTNMCDSSYNCPSFSLCNFFEGTFEITLEEYNLISRNNNLIPAQYSYLINKRFQKINSTCKLYFKETFYSEKKRFSYRLCLLHT